MTDRERLLREWPTCRGWWVTQATHEVKRCERPAGHDGACATFLCQGDKEFVEALAASSEDPTVCGLCGESTQHKCKLENLGGHSIEPVAASARDGTRVAPIYRCPLGEHDVFTYPDGKIVPHFADDGTKCLASYRVLTNSAPDGALTSTGEGMTDGPGEASPSPLTSPAPPAGEWDALGDEPKSRDNYKMWQHFIKEGYHGKFDVMAWGEFCYAAGAAKPITGEMVLEAFQTYAPQAARLLGMQTINQIADQLQRGEK